MTTKQAYNDFLTALIPLYERREASQITEWVFENVTGMNRLKRSQQHDMVLPDRMGYSLEKYRQELLQAKPVQYVLHEAWFYKMKFYVNEDVLIPRPETEELVEWLVNDLKQSSAGQEGGLRLLDVGTGSGCMAIAIKTQLPDIQVVSLDISEAALAVARKNAGYLEAPVHFLQLDFLDESAWTTLGAFDVLVSNPPYIPLADKATLANNVRLFEPGTALFVPDDNPWVFYEKIAAFSRCHLTATGQVYVEIHENYARQVEGIFSRFGFEVKMRQDLYGKNRMIKASLTGRMS